MRRSSFRLSLVLCLAASVAAQSLNWHEYKNAGGNFSILMPSQPSDTTNQEVAGESHTIQANDNAVSYNVVYVKFRQEQTVDDANFKAHRDGYFSHFPNCKVASEQPADPDLNGFVGRSYRINCEVPGAKTSHIGNLYLGKHYFYSVFALFVPATSESPNVKKFVESFSLLDPTK